MGGAVRAAVLAAVLAVAAPQAGGWATTGATPAATAAFLADFNGDGIDDLVAGVPGEDIGGIVDAGVVNVLYGSGSGLPDGASQQLTQARPEAGDRFGAALNAGNFGSGGIDLAVGVPGEDVGSAADAGAVVVLIAAGFYQLLTQGGATDMGSVPGASEAGDRFGTALASGDFDANSADNLAVGAPGEDLDGVGDAGVVISLCGFDGQFAGCVVGTLRQATLRPATPPGRR